MKFSRNDQNIDLRDVTDRVEELRAERETIRDEFDAEPANAGVDFDAWVRNQVDYSAGDATELETLEALLDDLAGDGGDHDWEGNWYPLGLIHEDHFTEAMQELCEDIGDAPRGGFPSYYVIDWDATADNLRADYSSVDFDGATYWYR